jgi:hypothetical protein
VSRTFSIVKHQTITPKYKFQIKMPDAKLETADELHTLFSGDEKLKGLLILV